MTMLGLHHSDKTKKNMRKSHKGRTFTEEHKMNLRLHHKGSTGQHVSKKTRRKIGLKSRERKHTEETKLIIREKRKKQVITEETKNKLRLLRGEKANNWKGGITPVRSRVRDSAKYRQWRLSIFIRDNFTCQKCGDNKGGNLEAHHHNKSYSLLLKESRDKYPLLSFFEAAMMYKPLWDKANGITMCKKCHNKTRKKSPTTFCHSKTFFKSP